MSQVIAWRVDEEEAEDIQILAESNGYKDKSKFMRDLVRKEWDNWVRKQRRHFEDHPEEYISLEEAEKSLEERKSHVRG